MRKSEWIMIGAFLALALALFGLQQLCSPSGCTSVRISIGGEELGIYSLAQDQVIRLGTTNTLEIQDGRARMTEASCPDQTCIRQGSIGEKGGTIICLPNRIIIEGVQSAGTEPSGVDAIV